MNLFKKILNFYRYKRENIYIKNIKKNFFVKKEKEKEKLIFKM